MGVGLLAVALGAWLLVDRDDSAEAPPSRSEVAEIAEDAVAEGLEEAAAEPARSAQVYETIGPSLVVIRAGRSEDEAEDDGGALEGLGSGVIVNADGAILTARHVVAGASQIDVTFADGTDPRPGRRPSTPRTTSPSWLPTAARGDRARRARRWRPPRR